MTMLAKFWRRLYPTQTERDAVQYAKGKAAVLAFLSQHSSEAESESERTFWGYELDAFDKGWQEGACEFVALQRARDRITNVR